MSTRLPARFGLVLVTAVVGASSLVSAQPQPAAPLPVMIEPPPPPPERHGLFGGGGLWGGNISCNGDACSGFRAAGGGNGQIGYLFTPRLGVMLDIWALASKKDQVSITFVTATVNARYWVAPVFWIQGGVGSGHAIVSFAGLSGQSDDVPVGQLAAGFEIVRGHSWALDIQGKVAQGTSTKDNGGATTGRSAGIGVDMTWYASR